MFDRGGRGGGSKLFGQINGALFMKGLPSNHNFGLKTTFDDKRRQLGEKEVRNTWLSK